MEVSQQALKIERSKFGSTSCKSKPKTSFETPSYFSLEVVFLYVFYVSLISVIVTVKSIQ